MLIILFFDTAKTYNNENIGLLERVMIHKIGKITGTYRFEIELGVLIFANVNLLQKSCNMRVRLSFDIP